MLFEGFHLGMGNTVPPGIEGRSAEHHVLLSGNEVFLHPGETFEPDQFHPSGGIVKIGRQAHRPPALLYFVHRAETPDDLYIGIGLADLRNGIVARLVDIAVREKIEQVAGIEHPHFRLERFGTPRAYPLEVFDRGEKHIAICCIHGTKIG